MSCIKLFVSLCVLAVAAPAVNIAAPSITIASSEARLGSVVETMIAVAQTPEAGDRVFVVFGTGRGAATLNLANVAVTVPFGEAAWSAGEVTAAALGSGRFAFSEVLPSDPSLIDHELCAVVVIVKANGSVLVSARTGGPIIQDALS